MLLEVDPRAPLKACTVACCQLLWVFRARRCRDNLMVSRGAALAQLEDVRSRHGCVGASLRLALC